MGRGQDFDNEQFFRNFATSPDGNLYVPRAENLDLKIQQMLIKIILMSFCLQVKHLNLSF